MSLSRNLAGKVLVWAAAALMPLDCLPAASCGCIGPQRPRAGQKTFGISEGDSPIFVERKSGQSPSCCRAHGVKSGCCGTKACCCGHKAARGSARQQPCRCSVVCLCRPDSSSPTPTAPSGPQGSQTAQQLCRCWIAAQAVCVLPEAVRPCWDALGDSPPLAVTPPQRLSILCRFLL